MKNRCFFYVFGLFATSLLGPILPPFWHPKSIQNRIQEASGSLLNFAPFFDRNLTSQKITFHASRSQKAPNLAPSWSVLASNLGGARGSKTPAFRGLVGFWSQDGPKMAPRPSKTPPRVPKASLRSSLGGFFSHHSPLKILKIGHESPSFKRTSTVDSRLGATVPLLVVGLLARRKSMETSKQTN